MKPVGAHAIGALLPKVLKRTQQQYQALFTIQQTWPRLVGKQLAAHTKPVSLRRGRLIVLASQPGDSFALTYQRPQLLKRLQTTTKGRVEELVIRPGEAGG